MKFLKTTLAAALMAASVGASANILGSGLLQSEDATELMLIVYSPSAEASYVLDLGVSIADFKANGSSPAGWSFSRQVTPFFTNSVLANANDLRWAVTAFDTYAATSFLQSGDLQLLSTVQAGAAFGPENPGMTGDTLNNAVGRWVTYTGTVNLSHGNHQTTAHGSSFNVKADGPAYLLDPFAIGTNVSDQWAFNQFNAVGTASTFNYVTACDLPDGSCLFDGSLPALGRTFGNAAGMGMFNFNGTTLTYSLAPVPEPATYALLALGLLAVGASVRARRQG
jgi:hypothetical protein